MRKKIRIDEGFMEGYGGSGIHWTRITYGNILLARLESRSEGDIAVRLYKEKLKWRKDWTAEAWAKAIKGKKAASILCSVCGGNTLDGGISCVEMYFCKKCEPRIEEFKKKYQEAHP